MKSTGIKCKTFSSGCQVFVTLCRPHWGYELCNKVYFENIRSCQLNKQEFICACILSRSNQSKSIGIERVLTSDPRAWVFAPQYPTRMGKVLGQLWYLPISKTILIDLNRIIINVKSAEKFCGYGKFDVLVDTSLAMQVFSVRVLRGSKLDSTRTWIFLNTGYPTSTWFFIPVPPLISMFCKFRSYHITT